MHRVVLPETGILPAWREAARPLAARRVDPGHVDWVVGEAEGGLLFADSPLPPGPSQPVRVPRAFLDLAGQVVLHRDPAAPGLLYTALIALQSRPRLLQDAADPLVRRLESMAGAVRRDIHKMRAFVRFRELPAAPARRRFAAWFEPDHRIVEANAGFFARRFADMDWTILTPDLSAIWQDGRLSLGPGAVRPDLPEDAAESLWATYFANIFNPARVKLDAMRSEMPRKYWKNLPETRQIPAMLAGAEARVRAMREAGASPGPARATAISARYRASIPQPPDRIASLADARSACAACTRCDLCHTATQSVFGEGAEDAPLMILGEQPGDHEDLAGRPFVGPAGQVLDRALAAAGLDRRALWLTNAVKHFKFVPRGRQRIHQRPGPDEIRACHGWLDLELSLIRPRLTVALGVTAARALTGRGDGFAGRRGRIEQTAHGPVLMSWHPAHVLRLPGGDSARAFDALCADLRLARQTAELPAFAPTPQDFPFQTAPRSG